MPFTTPTTAVAGNAITASLWNTDVKGNFDELKFGHLVCTSSTRPSGAIIGEGSMIYETDTNLVLVYNGADWIELHDLDNTGAVNATVDDYLGQYAVQSRNVIINGAMQIAQRATSVAGITTSGYRTADRWTPVVISQGTWTNTIENDAPTGSGFRKSLKMLCTTADAAPAAGDMVGVDQVLEGQNIQHFLKGTSSAKKFAVQFWVKSNVTGTYVVEMYDNDNNRHVGATYSISASGTWEKKTIVIPADTTGAFDNDNAGSLYFRFYLGAGSNRTSGTLATSWASFTQANDAVGQINVAAATNNFWQVTGVQLEAGDVNTPFEFEPYETTLRKCQRYYYYIYSNGNGSGICHGQAYSTTGADFHIPMPVRMRTVPTSMDTTGTASNYGVTNSAGSGIAHSALPVFTSSAASTEAAAYVQSTVSSGLTAGNSTRLYFTTGGAYLGFSAEL